MTLPAQGLCFHFAVVFVYILLSSDSVAVFFSVISVVIHVIVVFVVAHRILVDSQFKISINAFNSILIFQIN